MPFTPSQLSLTHVYNGVMSRAWYMEDEVRTLMVTTEQSEPEKTNALPLTAATPIATPAPEPESSAAAMQEDEPEPVKEKPKRAPRAQSAPSAPSARPAASKPLDWDYDALPVKIPLPPQLRKQLNDESVLINNSKELVPLPRTPSASDIMDNWARDYASGDTSEVLSVIDMLKALFQDELGNHLLYRLERYQYAEYLSRNPQFSVDKTYGAEHLLRLFVILPWFLSNARLEENTVHSIKIVVANLMEYMRLNMSTIFAQDYEPASLQALQDAGLSS